MWTKCISRCWSVQHISIGTLSSVMSSWSRWWCCLTLCVAFLKSPVCISGPIPTIRRSSCCSVAISTLCQTRVCFSNHIIPIISTVYWSGHDMAQCWRFQRSFEEQYQHFKPNKYIKSKIDWKYRQSMLCSCNFWEQCRLVYSND